MAELKPFSNREISFIEKYYPTKGRRWVGIKLKRTSLSIACKAHKLGITHNSRDWEIQENRFKDHCLKNNMVPLWLKWSKARCNKLVRCTICQHEWKANPGACYREGAGCLKCCGTLKKTDSDYHELADRFKGEWVDGKVPCTNIPTKWKCKHGHVFSRSFSTISKLGTFCTECSTKYIGEQLTRCALEGFTGFKFPKVRPELLRFKGNKLELDGYNEKRGLAFEYNGSHHYKRNKHFQKTNADLNKCKEKDKFKKRKCSKEGIRLLIIKEKNDRYDIQYIYEKVKDFLLNSGIPIINFTLNELKSLIPILISSDNKDRYLAFAKQLNIEIITKEYLDSYSRISVRCLNCNANREISINDIAVAARKNKTSYCMDCNVGKKYTLNRVKDDCKKVQLTLLSMEGEGFLAPIVVRCNICGKERKTIADVVDQAVRDGKKTSCRSCSQKAIWAMKRGK